MKSSKILKKHNSQWFYIFIIIIILFFLFYCIINKYGFGYIPKNTVPDKLYPKLV